ncbi:hypothetical protein ACFQBQ_07715 [Granulicella cerasi]|uniref:Uncharacterized protein n=1 Tax=Granulicella cerasi TaxID=741063 RepID=A0ABW1Z8N5_9BACT|nr:hypothetical protein [Granulicella cerasi]
MRLIRTAAEAARNLKHNLDVRCEMLAVAFERGDVWEAIKLAVLPATATAVVALICWPLIVFILLA